MAWSTVDSVFQDKINWSDQFLKVQLQCQTGRQCYIGYCEVTGRSVRNTCNLAMRAGGEMVLEWHLPSSEDEIKTCLHPRLFSCLQKLAVYKDRRGKIAYPSSLGSLSGILYSFTNFKMNSCITYDLARAAWLHLHEVVVIRSWPPLTISLVPAMSLWQHRPIKGPMICMLLTW